MLSALNEDHESQRSGVDLKGGNGGKIDARRKFSRNKIINFKSYPTFLLSPTSASGMRSWVASRNA